MKRQVPGRLLAAALALYASASSFYAAESLGYAIATKGGLPAAICMQALAALALAALVDTVINDILPASWHWRCGVRNRQALWMLISVTYAGLAFTAMRETWGLWLAGYYVICASHCASISFIDLWQEYQDKQRGRRASDNRRSHA